MSPQTVLVIEDSAVEAEMLARGLRGTIADSSVLFATSTTDAERILFHDSPTADHRSSNPDLVFLDVRIPPSGGLLLLQKLRADPRTRNIPVVMVSSQMRDEDVHAFYRSGANSYLDKPVDFHDFLTMVRAAARYWLGLNLNAKQGR